MVIEKVFPKTSSHVLYAALSLIHKWMMLLKESDGWRMSQVKDMVICWMRSFKPSLVILTDVHEI